MGMRRDLAWDRAWKRFEAHRERLTAEFPDICNCMRAIGRKSLYRIPLAMVEQLARCKDDEARRILLGTGNPLKVGDLVAIHLDRPLIFGQVTEIDEGGLVVGHQDGSLRTQMGHAAIMCKQLVPFDPAGTCGAVLALRDDNNRARVGKEAKGVEKEAAHDA